MELNTLEKSILDRIIEERPGLASTVASVRVSRREYTGAGFYTYFQGTPESNWDRPPIDGPSIESPDLDAGGGSLLWLSGGIPSCLEIYANGNDFPEYLRAFELSS